MRSPARSAYSTLTVSPAAAIAEGTATQRFWNHVEGNHICIDLGCGEAHAVDGDRVTRHGAFGIHTFAPNGQANTARIAVCADTTLPR